MPTAKGAAAAAAPFGFAAPAWAKGGGTHARRPHAGQLFELEFEFEELFELEFDGPPSQTLGPCMVPMEWK